MYEESLTSEEVLNIYINSFTTWQTNSSQQQINKISHINTSKLFLNS